MDGTKVINNVNIQPHLIGDTAYPLSPYLMTAYHSGSLKPRATKVQQGANETMHCCGKSVGKVEDVLAVHS